MGKFGKVLFFLSPFALNLAFSPFPFRFLAYFSLVPLFYLITKSSLKKALFYSFLFFFLFALFHLWWLYFLVVPVLEKTKFLLYLGVFVLFGYFGLYGLVFGLGVKKFGLFIAPLLWALLEFIRTKSEIGFPWGLLGYTQTPYLPLIQFASITGVYGLSAFVVFLNLIIYQLLFTRKKRWAITLILTFLIPLSYGLLRMKGVENNFKVAIIQPNVSPNEKGDRSTIEENIRSLLQLTQEAIKEKPFLLIYPETASLFDLTKEIWLKDEFLRISQTYGVYILIGTPIYEDNAYFNGAVLIDPENGITGIYKKIHPVPFSERIPYIDKFPIFKPFATADMGNFTPGKEFTVFSTPLAKASCLICFESIFPDLTREFVLRGADLLVNITNDGWFGKTPGPYQHCELAVMRSVELGKPLLRSANNGISLIVSPYGEVIKKTPLFTEMVLYGNLPKPLPSTFYLRFGDWFIYLSIIILILRMAGGSLHRRKSVGLLIFVFSAVIVNGATDCRYLIITNEKFFDALQPLKEWKTKKGVKAEIVKVPYRASPDSIKRIIKSIGPEYLLLVGDKNYIPPGDSLYYSYQLLLGDNFYGDMEGDYRAEIPVGRLPCRNVDECQTMVQKILTYERFPKREDTLWYKRATLIFMWDFGGRPANPIYSEEFPYDDSILRLRYSKVDTIFNDTLFGHQGYDDADDIIASLNEGSSLVLYRGHASGNWAYPFTVEPEDERLQNGYKLPIIISGSCHTIFKSENTVGERWLRVKGGGEDLKGAVAFFGTQLGGGFGRWRGRFVRTFLRTVMVNDNLILGKAFLRGKDSIASPPYSGDANEYFYREWSLLGDPELNIWTKVPKPMVVSHKFLGSQIFVVEVKDSITGQPIPKALVCLTKPLSPDFYYYGTTDKDGQIKFPINGEERDEIIITVTAPNYLPYESPLFSLTYSNPFRQRTNIRYQIPNRQWLSLNIYDITGRLVRPITRGVKEPGIYTATWDGKDQRKRSLPPGIYFFSLQTKDFSISRKVILIK